MSTFKPMLAGKRPKDMPFEEYIESLAYPLLASPKLDGIRCLTMQHDSPTAWCRPVTRSLKDIPNRHIRDELKLLPAHLDGELVSGENFQNVQTNVMSHGGTPDFEYHLFDYFRWDETFDQRFGNLKELAKKLPDWVKAIPHYHVTSASELRKLCDDFAQMGYEGACVRDPEGPYKYGRSTYKQGWLLKIVALERINCTIIGFTEKMHNANEATTNVLGHMERSSHKGNMVPMGTLGALIVRDVEGQFEQPFQVGTGFDDATRQQIWDNRAWWLGLTGVVEYKPYGTKDKPRTPVWIGERHHEDGD